MRLAGLVLLGVLNVACGGPAECPPRPEPLDAPVLQCVSNGCGLASLSFHDLGCSPLTPLRQTDRCDHLARYRCANELFLTLAYTAEGVAYFDIRGALCVTSYVLSAEPVECAPLSTPWE